jgi:hypothetical protein
MMEDFAIVCGENAEGGRAEMQRLFQHRVEHWRKIAGRGVYDLQDFGGRSLLLQRLALLVQQPRVLHCDHGLRREVLQQGDLFLHEWPNLPETTGNHPE